MLYGTTPDFLRAFGLSSIEALPQTAEEIKAMFARLDGAEEEADKQSDTQISLADELLMAIAESEQPEEVTEEKGEVTIEPESIAQDDYDNQPSAEDDIQIDEI